MNDNLKKTMDAAKKVLEACRKDPKLADSLVKALRPGERGVHSAFEIQSNFPRKRGGFQDVKGKSGMGHWTRTARSLRSQYLPDPSKRQALISDVQAAARGDAKRAIAEQRAMPKPNLPKSEPMDKKALDPDRPRPMGSESEAESMQHKGWQQKGTHVPTKVMTHAHAQRTGSDAKEQSLMGIQVRRGHPEMARGRAQQGLREIRSMPKPNLPKSEPMDKTQGVPKGVDKDKMENCVQDVKGQSGVKNKYAICAASLQGKTHHKMEKGEFAAMVKADDDKFSKLRKDPPSEGTGLPKPESEHETPADRKEKKVSLTKEEIEQCMKADEKFPWWKNRGGSKSRNMKNYEASKDSPASKKAKEEAEKAHAENKKHLVRNAVKKDEKNSDEKADAALGEKVESTVEQHMKENAVAERQEGHKVS